MSNKKWGNAMTKRKSFILHYDALDILEELSNEQAGELLKAMLEYHTTGKHNLEGMMKVVFIPFKNQFDRDNEKYKETCKRNRINGLKNKKKNNPLAPTRSHSLKVDTQTDPNIAYNDSDNDSDSKNDNNNKPDFLSEKSLEEFKEHRVKLKKPMSDLAVSKFINKLRKLHEQNYCVQDLIDEAIENGWQTVYTTNHKPKTITRNIMDRL